MRTMYNKTLRQGKARNGRRQNNGDGAFVMVEGPQDFGPHEEPQESPTDIVRADFDIYFTPNQIVGSTSSTFAQVLREVELDALQLQTQLRLPAPPPVTVYINSMGGDLHAGLAMHDVLKRIRVPVTTVVEGAAASAATLLSVAAAHRSITPNSMMLIHQLSAGFMGTYQQFGEELENQVKLMNKIMEIYRKHTKLGENPEMLEELLSSDRWLTAEECLSLGLVDTIL